MVVVVRQCEVGAVGKVGAQPLFSAVGSGYLQFAYGETVVPFVFHCIQRQRDAALRCAEGNGLAVVGKATVVVVEASARVVVGRVIAVVHALCVGCVGEDVVVRAHPQPSVRVVGNRYDIV